MSAGPRQRPDPYAEGEELAPGVLRLPLPSDTLPPYDHTNTYLIGAAGVAAVVDPGFRPGDGTAVLAHVMERAGIHGLRMVLLTHTHRDHLAGLSALRERYGPLPVYVHPAEADRVPGDGPVVALGDGRALAVAGLVVRAVHTPGHAPGHLTFHLPGAGGALCGDLLTAEGSTWVGLPEGDAGRYLDSLERVEALGTSWLGPGHGPAARDPAEAIARARARREGRARRILDALDEPRTLDELRECVYGDLGDALRERTEASLLAHLAHLMRGLRVMHLGDGPGGPYRKRP